MLVSQPLISKNSALFLISCTFLAPSLVLKTRGSPGANPGPKWGGPGASAPTGPLSGPGSRSGQMSNFCPGVAAPGWPRGRGPASIDPRGRAPGRGTRIHPGAPGPAREKLEKSRLCKLKVFPNKFQALQLEVLIPANKFVRLIL